MADPTEPDVFAAATDGFEDAGGSMMGGGFGAKPEATGAVRIFFFFRRPRFVQAWPGCYGSIEGFAVRACLIVWCVFQCASCAI